MNSTLPVEWEYTIGIDCQKTQAYVYMAWEDCSPEFIGPELWAEKMN